MPRVSTGSLRSIKKTYYPSSRWHYAFETATAYYHDLAFMAPDEETIISETYDIERCATLSPAVPGGKLYVSDEIIKGLSRWMWM